LWLSARDYPTRYLLEQLISSLPAPGRHAKHRSAGRASLLQLFQFIEQSEENHIITRKLIIIACAEAGDVGEAKILCGQWRALDLVKPQWDP